MASGGSTSREGRPLGALSPPLVPVRSGPELHPPMDLSLLDVVDEWLADLSVQPLSPKSKKLRDMEVYAKAQNAEFEKLVASANARIVAAESAALKAQAERDLVCGVGASPSLPTPGLSRPDPSSFSFLPPHPPSLPPSTFISSLGPRMGLEAME